MGTPENTNQYKQLPGKQGMVFLRMLKDEIYCVKPDKIS
jgi:hypothetical protein